MFHLENEAKETMFRHQFGWFVWYNYNLTYYDAQQKTRTKNPNLKNQTSKCEPNPYTLNLNSKPFKKTWKP
jgi:hypothetical protein